MQGPMLFNFFLSRDITTDSETQNGHAEHKAIVKGEKWEEDSQLCHEVGWLFNPKDAAKIRLPACAPCVRGIYSAGPIFRMGRRATGESSQRELRQGGAYSGEAHGLNLSARTVVKLGIIDVVKKAETPRTSGPLAH